METVVITGANRGIGLEMAKQLLNTNRRVIAGCRNPAEATALNDLASDGDLSVLQLDVSDSDSIKVFCAQLSGQTIDVLINNAGVLDREKQGMLGVNAETWLETFKINSIAPFEVAVGLLDNLKKSSRPRIVSVSSQLGSLSLKGPGLYSYNSSKAALNQIMKIMSQDLEADGFIVCPIHPGWVQTDMGGSEADITPQQSAGGIISFIDNLTMEQSGRFWQWNGEEHPW